MKIKLIDISTVFVSLVVAGVFLSLAGIANAAEIKLFSSFATRALVEDVVPKFEKASGHKVANSIANTSGTLKRIQGGDIPDVVITNQAGMDGLTKDGKIASGNVTVIARVGLGVAVRKGAPKPDISSSETFKRTLLAAKSVTSNSPTDGGASGPQFAKVLERLGISKEMKSKMVYAANDVGMLVANGKAELGVSQISSLVPVKGIDIVGPLPGDLQVNSVYLVAIPTGAKNAEAAKALVTFLRGPEAAKSIKSKGMEPA